MAITCDLHLELNYEFSLLRKSVLTPARHLWITFL